MRYDIRFTPNPPQYDAYQSTKENQVTWLCGGLGSGKTHMMVHWVFQMAAFEMPGRDGLIVVPDYSTWTDTFMSLFRQQIPGEGVIWWQKNTATGGKQIVINTGQGDSTVFVRSAMNVQNVQRIDGLTTLCWAAMDEPARMLCGESAFEKTLGRLRNTVRGWKYNPILIVGSPRGLHHWTARVFGCSEDHPDYGYVDGYYPDTKKRPGYFIRACYTQDNADNLRDGYEEEARILYSEALASQEFNASLISTQGMILPEWSKPLHVIPHALALEIWERRVVRPVGGIDWGFTAPGSIAICGWTGDQEFIVIDEWYKRQRQKQEQGEACLAYMQLYGKKFDAQGRLTMPFYADEAEPGSVDLLRKGFRTESDPMNKVSVPVRAVKKGAGSWQAGIDVLRNLMGPRPTPHPNFPDDDRNPGCPRLLVSDKCVNLIKEIPAYRQMEQKEGKRIEEGADPTCQDHMIDAIRYAAYSTDVSVGIQGYSHRNRSR